MKQKKGCGGLTEEDCVPRALRQRCGRRGTNWGKQRGWREEWGSGDDLKMQNGGWAQGGHLSSRPSSSHQSSLIAPARIRQASESASKHLLTNSYRPPYCWKWWLHHFVFNSSVCSKVWDYVSSAVFSCHGTLSFSLLKAIMLLLNPLCFSDQGS